MDVPCTAQLSDGLRAALQSGKAIATGRDATFAEREAANDLRTALAAIWTKHPALTADGFMDLGEPGYAASRAKILTYPEDFELACAFILSGDLGPRYSWANSIRMRSSIAPSAGPGCCN